MKLADCPTSVRRVWTPPAAEEVPGQRRAARRKPGAQHRKVDLTRRPLTEHQQRVLAAVQRGTTEIAQLAALIDRPLGAAYRLVCALKRRGLVHVTGVGPGRGKKLRIVPA